MSLKDVELEAWFISDLDKSSWPSGTFARNISKDIPFVVYDPLAIRFFTDYSKHNGWIKKITIEKARAMLGITDNPITEEQELANHQMAIDRIRGLDKQIAGLNQTLKSKDEKISALDTELDDALQYKDKYDKAMADIERLKQSIEKLKRKKGEEKEEPIPK